MRGVGYPEIGPYRAKVVRCRAKVVRCRVKVVREPSLGNRDRQGRPKYVQMPVYMFNPKNSPTTFIVMAPLSVSCGVNPRLRKRSATPL